MQAASSSGRILPHQESKRIIQDIFPHRVSIDDFHDAAEAIPPASVIQKDVPAVASEPRDVADENAGSPSAERGSTDTLRDEKRAVIGFEEENGRDQGSSDTIGDEEKHYLRTHKDTPLEQNSISSIEDVEKQDPGTTETDHAHRASGDLSRDVEKGATNSKEFNEVDQGGEDERQTQWENNVVGWDGPNDPQNPQNWKRSKKYTITVFYASLTFCITFASSAFSTATEVTAKMYGVSNEVMTLGTSLFVLVSAYCQHHSSSTDTSNRVSPSAQ